MIVLILPQEKEVNEIQYLLGILPQAVCLPDQIIRHFTFFSIHLIALDKLDARRNPAPA